MLLCPNTSTSLQKVALKRALYMVVKIQIMTILVKSGSNTRSRSYVHNEFFFFNFHNTLKKIHLMIDMSTRHLHDLFFNYLTIFQQNTIFKYTFNKNHKPYT